MRLTFEETHNFWYKPRPDPLPPVPHPMLPVTLRNGARSFPTYALLDTGADDCLFHGDFARRIGLVVDRGRFEYRYGIDPASGIECYIHGIDLTIGNQYTLRCDVAFSDDISDDLFDQLIGRELVFDHLRFAVRQRFDKVYVGRKP